MGKFQFSLDKPLPLYARIFLLVVAISIPTTYVLKQYGASPHFAKLIFFGKNKEHMALPEVNALNPPRESLAGYDGQFYAQVALHPTLTYPDLKTAVDMPSYRSRRILVPAIAYVLGLGRTAPVLEAYAVLNLVFWISLLLGMAWFLKAQSVRDYLCIFAAAFTTGSLISVERALTDLPAATLLFYAAALGTAAATGTLAMAVLARETSAIYLVRFLWPPPKNAKDLLILAARTAVVMAPLVLWVAYINHVFGSVSEPTHPFVVPGTGWVKYMGLSWYNFTHMTWQTPWSRPLLSWREALHHPGTAWSRWWGMVRAYLLNVTLEEWLTFELLAPLSLFAQVCFFAIWRTPQSPYWRMGVIFALMMLCMTTSQEEIAYCRAVLPVTIGFNICLMKLRGRAFAYNFIAGNLGLLWGLHDMLAFCLNSPKS